MSNPSASLEGRELRLDRHIDASPEQVFRAYTDPEILKQWFVPAPWKVASADLDPRSGGKCVTTFADPEGNEYPNEGIYLEIVPNRRVVFTDTYFEGWVPNPEPFMTAIIDMEPSGDGTDLHISVRHQTAEGREKHETMGFYDGWGKTLDQMQALLSEAK